MPNTLRQFFYHKPEPPDIAPLHLKVGTHLITKTLLPDTGPGDLIVSLGPHRRLKGPMDVRLMSYEEIVAESVETKGGTYMCVQVLCDPTEDYIKDPTIEVCASSLTNEFRGQSPLFKMKLDGTKYFEFSRQKSVMSMR